MSNLPEEQLSKEDYNKIPVHYCVTCGSLNIKILPGTNEDYCDDCGGCYTSKASIEAWQELQKTKYKPLYRERHAREEKIDLRGIAKLFE